MRGKAGSEGGGERGGRRGRKGEGGKEGGREGGGREGEGEKEGGETHPIPEVLFVTLVAGDSVHGCLIESPATTGRQSVEWRNVLAELRKKLPQLLTGRSNLSPTADTTQVKWIDILLQG